VYVEDDLLPLSALEHLVFCERQCALIHIEQLWDENQATAEGQHLHERAHDAGTESRGDVRISRGLMMRSLRLGLSGRADVVEFCRLPSGSSLGTQLDGATGHWRPYPVEYKRGRLRHERSYEVQLCAQALCLEEMLGVAVPAGALFYGKSASRQVIAFGEDLRSLTETAAARLQELFRQGKTPIAEYAQGKCGECSLLDVCLPKVIAGRVGALKYVDHALCVSDRGGP
jgi:CRISPR-associated exonuclease Cas4